MSAIDDKTRLQHIRDAAQKIIAFTDGKERSVLAEDDRMRNRLVHAYFDIDLDVVWDTVTLSVPDLLKQVETILATDF